MFYRGLLLVGLTLSLLASTWAEPTLRELSPPDTGAGIVTVSGPHRLLVEPDVAPNGLLLVTLGGTNSRPSDLAALGDLAAGLGYRVLALDYPNSVISTKAAGAGSPDGFAQFREEIVVGAAVSSVVEVDAANSIENRLLAALSHAGPDFTEFLRDGQVRWDKVVVVGHSQGSGHAAYLAKRHRVQAVLLLAGPQDSGPAGPSGWLSQSSATPPANFLALLHRDDSFDSTKQVRAVAALRGQSKDQFQEDVVVLESVAKDPHMAVIDPQNGSHWERLLRRAAEISEVSTDDRVAALEKAAKRKYIHSWVIDPDTGMNAYHMVEEPETTWALTASTGPEPRQYAVWRWERGAWTLVLSYQGLQQSESLDPGWDRRVDFLYRSRGLSPVLRRRLEAPGERKAWPR